MRKLIVAALTAALLIPAGVLARTSAAGPLPRALQFDSGPARYLTVRPPQIFWTGDGSGVLGGTRRLPHGGRLERMFGRIRWISWTTTGAEAKGANWIDECSSLNCKESRPHAIHRGTIRLSRPQVVAGQLIFTRLVATSRGVGPFRMRLLYRDGDYGWALQRG